jgi:hypothetical protein
VTLLTPVLAQLLAMVARDADDELLGQAPRFEVLIEGPDVVVHGAEVGVIPLDERGLVGAGTHAPGAGRRQGRVVDDVRCVQIEVVHEQEEGVRSPSLQVRVHERVRRQGHTRRVPAMGITLRALPLPVVREQVEALVEPVSPVEVRDRDSGHGEISVALQHLGDGLDLGRKTSSIHHHSMLERMQGREERAVAGSGGGQRDDHALEDETLARQRVEEGGSCERIAVGTDVIGTERVHADEDDAGTRSREAAPMEHGCCADDGEDNRESPPATQCTCQRADLTAWSPGRRELGTHSVVSCSSPGWPSTVHRAEPAHLLFHEVQRPLLALLVDAADVLADQAE